MTLYGESYGYGDLDCLECDYVVEASTADSEPQYSLSLKWKYQDDYDDGSTSEFAFKF